MKSKSLLATVLGTLLLTVACDEFPMDQFLPKGDSEIKFTTSVYQFTKATDTEFENGDNIGISIMKGGNFFLCNTKWTFSNGQLTSDVPYKWYDDAEATAAIVAMYPWREIHEVDSTVSFTVNSDQTTHTLYTASDLMLATAASKPTSEAIPLQFKHALSKIVVTLDNRLGEDIIDLYFTDLYGTINFDINYPENFYTSGQKGAIRARNLGKNQWCLIVVPQENASPKLTIVTKSNKYYTYSLTENVTFRSGKLNTAEVTLATEDKYTSFTPEIQDWTADNELNFSQTTGSDNDASSGLIFKEIYYGGSSYETGEFNENGTPSKSTYFRDQFYEIYNNSNKVLYADGLCICDTEYARYDFSLFFEFSFVDGSVASKDEYVFTQTVWQLPGDGDDYPIQPGESFIIAQWATNHKADELTKGFSPVDLSGAEFEAIEGEEVLWNGITITDGPAQNMSIATNPSGYVTPQWLTAISGSNMVLFKPSTPLRQEDWLINNDPDWVQNFCDIKIEDVLDAVQMISDESIAINNYLGMPKVLDAGYIWCSSTYTGESVSRKQIGTLTDGSPKYADTNNTCNDFVVNNKAEVRRNGAKIPSWNTWATR